MPVQRGRDPYLKKDIAKVEKVQRKAARFCTGIYKQTASVRGMIEDLGWDTLEIRRRKSRLNMMYKLSHKIVNFDTSEHLVLNSKKRKFGVKIFGFFELSCSQTNTRLCKPR